MGMLSLLGTRGCVAVAASAACTGTDESTSTSMTYASPHRDAVDDAEPGGQKWPAAHGPEQLGLARENEEPKTPPGHWRCTPWVQYEPGVHAA